jgi:tetratricopeptide (TPR) repeat protein
MIEIRCADADAADALEKAVVLDPLSPPITEWVSGVYLQLGRPEDAERHARRAIDTDPTISIAYGRLGDALLAQGKPSEALAAYDDGLRQAPGLVRLRAARGRGLAGLGTTAEAHAVARQLELEAASEYVAPDEVAGLWASLGEEDLAFEWLERALRERSSGLVFISLKPEYARLRSDRRYDELVRKVGLPQRGP